MVQNIGVEKVRGKQGIEEFIRFPWEIYKDDPFWVPPLLEEQRVMFSPRYPFFEHGEIELYLARREKETVGRVAAVLDRDYVDFSHERAVFFGFFESIQDGDVARALIDEVRVWGKAQEMKAKREREEMRRAEEQYVEGDWEDVTDREDRRGGGALGLGPGGG